MFYLNGNYFDGTCPQLNPAYQSLLEEVNNDNWVGLQPNETSGVLLPSGGKSAIQANSEFTITDDAALFTQSASEAYKAVLLYAGASLKSDAVDRRIVDNVRNGDYTASGSNGSVLGLIDKATDVGGWPVYVKENAPVDTDGDGIANVPEYYETTHGRKVVGGSQWVESEKFCRWSQI